MVRFLFVWLGIAPVRTEPSTDVEARAAVWVGGRVVTVRSWGVRPRLFALVRPWSGCLASVSFCFPVRVDVRLLGMVFSFRLDRPGIGGASPLRTWVHPASALAWALCRGSVEQAGQPSVPRIPVLLSVQRI